MRRATWPRTGRRGFRSSPRHELLREVAPWTVRGSGKTAEGEGFEPPGTCIPRLFKSLAFGRSAIPPDPPSLPIAFRGTAAGRLGRPRPAAHGLEARRLAPLLRDICASAGRGRQAV